MQLNKLSLTEMTAMVDRGEASAEGILDACLARIDIRENDIQAFEYLNRDAARKQCLGLSSGPLRGLPIAVKDIIDTVDMPTAWGSPVYTGHRPVRDAGCVRTLRRAGATILGKTVTTEFACFHPGKTRNPHNLDHTPGGSSMGSAAAVADCMVPAALGSQTAASVIRPAAYCGVVGYKSSHGAFDLGGVCGLAQSLDSLGFFARELTDIRLLRNIYLGAHTRMPRTDSDRMRIGFVRTPHWNEATGDTRDLLDTYANKLAIRGVIIEEVTVGPSDGALTEAHKTVMAFEAARARAYEVENFPDLVSEGFRTMIEGGWSTTFADYRASLTLAQTWQMHLKEIFNNHDLLLCPSAPGEAPSGLSATGDPLFSRMWTLLKVPSLTLPAGHGTTGLPLGIQLVGDFGEDDKLVADAEWVAARL